MTDQEKLDKRQIGPNDYARLRKQALDGDLTGAERGLLEALEYIAELEGEKNEGL